jgi:hypothetical protein
MGMAELVLNEATYQVEAKKIDNEDDRSEFMLGCVALIYLRLWLRFSEDLDSENPVPDVFDLLRLTICKKCGYSAEEFNLAIVAVNDRVRLPYGYLPLQLAHLRSTKRPIRLLKEGLGELTTQIASIALQLQRQQRNEPIMLPVEKIRQLLGLRKLVVSGALTQLIEAGLLQPTDGTWHTGKAREFRFAGKENEDYEEVVVAVLTERKT